MIVNSYYQDRCFLFAGFRRRCQRIFSFQMSVLEEVEPPPRKKPTIIAAPKVRQMYWCHLPKDAELPELWKRRPVIVVSTKNLLHGAVTAIPTTTVPQPGNPWAVQLQQSMVPNELSWAICDKPMTLATSRLRAERGKIPRLEESEFNVILARLLDWLPKLPKTTNGQPS